MGKYLIAVALLGHSIFGGGRVISPDPVLTVNKTSAAVDTELNLRPGDRDPTDFGWVHRIAAIGDSFTAGIGAGNQLGAIFHQQDSWKCSRYDRAYPMLIKDLIGPSVDDFQFLACSGDRSMQIYEQVEKMEGDVNLVLLTAGGNDLCLAGIIKKCVLMPYSGEEACNEIIDKAQSNIESILRPNLKSILKLLKKKMARSGAVVFNSYAVFFNTQNEDCADQKWAMGGVWPGYWGSPPLKLTVKRRKKLNRLVVNVNAAIKKVVSEAAAEFGLLIGFSHWEPWIMDGVPGQMCHPKSTGSYPDKKQPDLQFFKPNTNPDYWGEDDGEQDERNRAAVVENGSDPSGRLDRRLYDSLLWKSKNPSYEARYRLRKAGPTPPDCPGDHDWIDPTLGLGLPDTYGKFFHPNELGHQTIASFAVATAIDLRAKVLGVPPQLCTLYDEFVCWQKDGRKAYANADRLNENYEYFCDNVELEKAKKGWKGKATYLKGTPDEHTFIVETKDHGYPRAECRESFERIINGCDGDDPKNPMNWKFGGRRRRGGNVYELNIERENRPWPVISSPYGSCKSKYKFVLSSYELRGAGFCGSDWGRDTLLPSIKRCLGLGVTSWKFEYFDEPDEDGNEWWATFNTPVFVMARCFNNNKAVRGAGGFTDGCSGSDI